MGGFATILDNVCVRTPVTTQELTAANACFASANKDCCYTEYAFTDDNDPLKQDKTSIIAAKFTSSDTIEIQIVKDGAVVNTVNGNTYGEYFSSFPTQPLYTGFIADWTLIFNAFGGGCYTLRINQTILGVSSTVDSRKFFVVPYNDELANRTVKIETYQNGNLVNSPFDFTNIVSGLGWYQSTRIAGTFGEKTPTLEEDKYYNATYELRQNYERVIYEYSLKTEIIPTSLASIISSTEILANEVFVTSYNIFDDEQYIQLPVAPTSFSDVSFIDDKGKVIYDIRFKDRTENNFKRNF